jgi:AraC-like DNA-binding protein
MTGADDTGLPAAGLATSPRTSTPIWWVTRDHDAAEQLALNQQIFGRSMPKSEFGANQDAPFGAKMVLRTQPDLGLMACYAPQARWMLRDIGPGDLILVRPSDGRTNVEQNGRTLALRARDAVLVSCRDPALFRFEGVTRVDALHVGRADLAGAALITEASPMQPVRRDSGALHLLANYGAGLLRGVLPTQTEALRRLITGHLRDLVAMMLEEANPIVAAKADARTARLAAIQVDIEFRLDRRDLTIEVIARLHRITPRYVQKLFEQAGTTFSAYVLRLRLERAWQRLTSNREAERPISEIAFDVGFGDLSYFNRTFRRHYGLSPSEARRRTDGAVPAQSRSA